MAAVIAVAKYGGGPDVLAWRFPTKGIGTWSKLVVNESQEAVLVLNGQPYDSFTSGEYELSTDKIPQLSQVMGLPDGVRSPLSVDIWYINKEYALEVKWGTPSPIELLDPKYKVPIPLKALGLFKVQVNESGRFLGMLVGTLPMLENNNLVIYFRNLLLGTLKENILGFLEDKSISAFELNTQIGELSERLKESTKQKLDKIGVIMTEFRVNNVKLPEDDPTVKKYNEALKRKAIADLVGPEYVQDDSIDPKERTGVAERSGEAFKSGSLSDSGGYNDVSDLLFTLKTCPVCYNDLDPKSRYCRECNYDTAEGRPRKAENAPAQTAETVAQHSNPVSHFTESTQIKSEQIVANTVSASGESTVRICSTCATKLREKQKFCHKCGGKLQMT